MALLGNRFALALLAAAVTACSVGHGEGELSGTVQVAGCRTQGRYDLKPSAFFAQAVQQLLRIRVQRGGELEIRSDGIAVLVEDASLVKRKYLAKPLSLAPDAEPRIDVSLFLNASCPPGRDKTPVVLSAASGTITFDEIYAPQVKSGEVAIAARIDGARFEDPRSPDRRAELSGHFDFLYERGGPAQRFP